MTATIKPGQRLKSMACATEVMVVKAPADAVLLQCGGHPMASDAEPNSAELAADFSAGTLMGKRYVNADGSLELLCIKPGEGSLALDSEALTTKQAQALPSSD